MFENAESLDDVHWINVQDPIKQMFLSLTKAIKSQAAGIRDLDRKYSELISFDSAERLVKEHFNSCCTKQDATQLIYQIDTKAGEKDIEIINGRMDEAMHQIHKLQDSYHTQAVSIAELNHRLDSLASDVHTLKNPNYDQIFSYIDRQIAAVIADTDRKLIMKADQREVETCIPQRIEDMYRSLTLKVNDMKVDIAAAATREEFQILANNKADGTEIRDILSELNDRVSRHELHQSVNNQIKPLVTAMSAIEKAVSIQDIASKTFQSGLNEKIQSVEKMYREQLEQRLLNTTAQESIINRDKVRSVVEDVLHERRIGEVTPQSIELKQTQQTEYLLKQMSILGESIRLEIVNNHREEFHSTQHMMNSKIAEVASLAKEMGDKHKTTRKTLIELSHNVAASLSKKLDVKEFRRTAVSSSGDGYGHTSNRHHSSNSGPMRSSSANIGYESRVHRSRDLMNTSRDDAFLSNESDVNKDFDCLMKSIRNQSNTAATGSDSSGGHATNAKRLQSPNRKHVQINTGSRSSSPSPFGEDNDNDSLGEGGRSKSKLRQSALNTSTNMSTTTRPVATATSVCFNRGQSNCVRQTRTSQMRARSTSPSNTTRTGMYSSSDNTTVDSLHYTVQRLATELDALKQDMSSVRDLTYTRLSTATTSAQQNMNSLNATVADLEKLDWRLALGEISMNIRRELVDKASREELYSVLRGEVDTVDGKITLLQKAIDLAATKSDLSNLESDLTALRNKVAGELTGARFLWTSGKLLSDGWMPWDIQVANAAPNVIIWRKGEKVLTVKVPGLYRLCVCVFTTLPAMLQIYLNDEPLFVYQPDTMDTQTAVTNQNPHIQKKDKYNLRRLRHSAGEVSSLCIDEHVSLPADSRITVRYYSAASAQAFFSIRKL